LFNTSSFASNWKRTFDSTSYYSDKGDVHRALEWGERALKESVNEFGIKSAEYERTLFIMIDLYYYSNDLEKTLEIAKLDSSVSKSVYGELSQYYCGSLNNLGLTYYFRGDYNSAEKVIQEAKLLQERMKNTKDSAYAFTLNNLALIYELTGKFTLSEPLYEKSLKLNKDTLGYSYAETVNNLAALYRRMGKYSKSDILYQKSLELNKRLKGDRHPDIALIYNNIGDLYKLMGRYDEAEPIYKNSVQLRKELFGKDNADYAKSLSNLGLLYFSMGRYDQAEPLLIEALDVQLKKKGEEHPEYIATLNNLALLYDAEGKLEKADTLFLKTLGLYKSKFGEENPFYSIALDNLAKLYKKMGFLDKAESMFLRAKDIRENVSGKKHPNYARTIFNLAELYRQMNKYDESETLYLEALDIRRELLGTEHPDFARSLSGLAMLYSKKGENDKAEPYFLEAMSKYLNQVKRFFPYLSEKEKLQFWSSLRVNFEEFTSFATKYYSSKPSISGMMFNNCLLTKGLILSSTKKIIAKIRESKEPKVIDLLNKWINTKNYWLWLVQNPSKAEELGIIPDSIANEANELEKLISSKSEDFQKAYKQKEVNWQDVRNVLKPGEAAIEIVRFRNNTEKNNIDEKDTVFYAALVITNESKEYPKMVLLKNGNELESNYIKLYGNLVKILRIQPPKISSDIEADILSKDQEELFQKYWSQIGKELVGINTVFLSVDGVYNSINLLTLRNPVTKKYLLDELDIRVLTNTKDLIEYRSKAKTITKNTAVLFGDPKYNLNPDDVQKIPALPGTRYEVESISDEMLSKKGSSSQRWKVQTYFEDLAKEESIKAVQNPKILHIATHGYFEKDVETGKSVFLGLESERAVENPLLRSMLFFAGAENSIRNELTKTTSTEIKNSTSIDDGRLTAYEAMDLNLDNTELVVMSACETGLGEVKNGEGVYGLQRAFQVAGSRSLIMSLWTVSDEATQVLMSTFYRKLLNGMEKRKAFRETQIDVKSVYPEFYYWGAFVMVGE